MKIEYDMGKNKLRFYDIANGLYLKRNKLKKGSKKTTRFSFVIFKYYLIFIIIGAFLNVIFTFLKINGDFLIWYSIFIFLYCFVSIYSLIFTSKIASAKGVIEIDEFGIKDTAEDGYAVFCPYSLMDMLIVTKDMIVICTTNNRIFALPKENKLKMVKEIEKYAKDLLVIRIDKQ